MHPSISIVIPVLNEHESLSRLLSEIDRSALRNGFAYEAIFVNDGSTDSTERILNRLHTQHPDRVRVIHFERNFGKALALQAGFALARYDIIVTMDADLQDDPAELPHFIRRIQAGSDLVSGWKRDRKDSFVKNSTSKLYNFVTSLASGVSLRDHNCGFKAYRAELARSLPLHSQLHRFIPLLASALGYQRIDELPVNHRKRPFGMSKYGMSRFLYGITGLVHALMLAREVSKRRRTPAGMPTYTLKQVLT